MAKQPFKQFHLLRLRLRADVASLRLSQNTGIPLWVKWGVDGGYPRGLAPVGLTWGYPRKSNSNPPTVERLDKKE